MLIMGRSMQLGGLSTGSGVSQEDNNSNCKFVTKMTLHNSFLFLLHQYDSNLFGVWGSQQYLTNAWRCCRRQ